jgi:hypothetical protein
MTPILRCSALILLCATVVACASDDGAGGPGSGGSGFGGPEAGGDGPGREASGRGPGRRLPNVFISPAGEPFRAAPSAPYPVADWFARADADHDGRLTREEFRADALAFFGKLDTNDDGIIDGAEVARYEQDVAPEILPRIESLHAEEGMDPSLTFGDQSNTDNRPDGSRHRQRANRPPAPARGIGTQGAAVYSLINAPEPVSAADTAFDGRITRAEFADAADRRFDVLDKASVGYLTLAALPKTPLQTEILKREKQARKHRDPHGPPPNSSGG